GIVQDAVDAARAVNEAGVVNIDCQPRNVMVELGSLRPVHIDFGNRVFAEEAGEELFEEVKEQRDNQGAIGMVMVTKLRVAAGVQL
ncbi:hypothetical protein B0H67DRAFT_472536, partial [Lasiosphaeris hirsuta]